MIPILKQELLHTTYLSPITKLHIELPLIVFIDDIELFVSVPDGDLDTLVMKAEKVINVWREVLQVTGRAMRPSKCAWAVMSYDNVMLKHVPINKVPCEVCIRDK